MPARTIDDVISQLPASKVGKPEKPAYEGPSPAASLDSKIGLAVESMKDHTTNEGHEIFKGLHHAGYKLVGHGCEVDSTHLPTILKDFLPGTIVMQDKREWDVKPGDFRDPQARFREVQELRRFLDVFKVTILKDAHQRPDYHRQSADEIGCHAWIVYYNPRIVQHVAGFTRPEHLIRTWHSLDAELVPPFDQCEDRNGCLLSGAVSSVYPLRKRLFEARFLLPNTTALNHPGYHRQGCHTPDFFKTLSRYKVAVCTSSIYGYALRKIAEATACGCIVLTDLPSDEVMPGGIDGNLIRITPDFTARRVGGVLRELLEGWNPDKQRDLAEKSKAWYDWRAVGTRLAQDIEQLRSRYNERTAST